MDFTYLKKKLEKNGISIDDIVIFFAFDNVAKYKENFVENILSKLHLDVNLNVESNKKIIELIEDEVKIEFFATLIEKMLSEEERKKSGSFYTVPNVVKHMVNQSLKFILLNNIDENLLLEIYSKKNIDEFLTSETKFYELLLNKNLKKEHAKKVFDLLMNAKILEPSSGAGTFLYFVIDYIDYVARNLALTFSFNYSVGNVINNIFANDINSRSLSISKLIAVHFLLKESAKTLEMNLNIISNNWTEFDFLEYSEKNTFDLIIGNPPYLEIKEKKYYNNETNLYSIFMRKALLLRKEKSVISFIIPNSFQTTPKYSNLREAYLDDSNYLIVESYNDRPASLFSGVHQRLNIIFSLQGEDKNLYTTDHKFHRKSEVKDLFDKIKYYKSNSFRKSSCTEDEQIFKKINKNNLNLLMLLEEKGRSLLISSRLGLWPKCFIDEYQSKEVMEFIVDEKIIYSLNAIFNSSTFYFYWILTSDTWHVTKRNLSEFKFNEEMLSSEILSKLGKKLMEDLEKSKIFVNTSQVQYEYKHRMHKKLIDKIDEEIMKHLKLSEKQYQRIIKFAEDYRMGIWK